MAVRKVTVEQLRAVAPDMSQTEAGRKFGVSRERVRQLANKHGIVFRDGWKLDADTVKSFADMAKTMTAAEMSDATGVPPSTAYSRAKISGLKPKPSRRDKCSRKFRIEIDMAIVLNLREHGKTWDQIGATLGLQPMTVYRRWLSTQIPGVSIHKLRAAQIRNGGSAS